MKALLKRIVLLLTVGVLLTASLPAVKAAEDEIDDAAEVQMIDLINDTLECMYKLGHDTMPYRLFVPLDYDADKKYPLLLFLHGAGERGDDNTAQLTKSVFDTWLSDSTAPLAQAIVIFPQCPNDRQWVDTPWEKGSYSVDEVEESRQMEMVLDILYDIIDEYSVDEDRVYVSGLSMGGFGTWDLLMRHSDIFAAAIPFCGGADPSRAELLADIPIWTFHGDADGDVPVAGTREIYNAIIAAGGEKIEYTEYEGYGHNVWSTGAAEPGIIEWLLSQRLSDRYPDDTSADAKSADDTSADDTSADEAPEQASVEASASALKKKLIVPAIIGASALVLASAALFIINTAIKRSKHAKSAKAAAIAAAKAAQDEDTNDKK